MNTIEKRVQDIKEDLDFFDDELQKYEYIIDIQKDETIFELLMLEAEVDILSEFSDIDLESFKNRIKVAKEMLWF